MRFRRFHPTKLATETAVSYADRKEKKNQKFRRVTCTERRKQGAWVAFALCMLWLFLVRVRPRYYPRPSHLRTSNSLNELQKVAHEHVVVSIGTMKSRQETLVLTLQSLFRQTVLPGRIQIQLDETEDYDTGLVRSKLHASFGKDSISRRVNVSFHPGPAHWKTARKLLGALWETWHGRVPPRDPQRMNSTMIILADDDVIYHPQWLESLLLGQQLLVQKYNKDAHKIAVGLRGWRVRSDLRWGAPPLGELQPGTYIPNGVWGSFPRQERYVILGNRLYEPYQVGVLVGCNGILLRPTLFDEQIFQAPTDLHFLLNDVWTSGNLARNNVERWVVPMLGDEPVGTHLGNHATVIDNQLTGVLGRADGNSKMLKHFKDYWESDLYWSADEKPPWRGFLPLRHFLSEHVLLRLYRIRWIRQLVGDFRMEEKDWKKK